jgi:molybdate transport system substrate-binding protein
MLAALLLVTAVACGKSEPQASSPKTAVTGHVTVFAAASLTAAFTDLGKQFESQNPGAKATLNFAASSALANQIVEGGQADVFASADEANMKKVAAQTNAPKTFARNRLEIVVEKGNPKQIHGLADLAKSGLVVVLCAAHVPCGNFADQALAKANVTVKVASREDNVKAVLTKVQLGEADAGIVYVTDVKSGGDKIEGVEVPDAQNVIATYPIATVKAAKNAAGAQAFVDLVTSAAGSQTLQRYGFLPPS